MANYIPYRKDRQNGPVGGTSHIIKSTIDHYKLQEPQLDKAEANGVAINMSNGEIIKLYSF